MGYREDGNFGFIDSYPISSGITNPSFTYPTRSIRFLEAQAAIDGVKDSYKIFRGYIRNLDQPALGAEFPVSKCKFQFNPQEIRQDVSMREDVYSSLLQTPEQLTQPIGGQTSFSFDLVFDRSMELASGKTMSSEFGQGYNVVSNVLGQSMENDVYEIGVLADLRVFYSVIGQGFSKEMLAFQMASLKKNYETGLANSASAGSPNPEILYDDTKLADVMSANYGNAAFLMPNPVRVLFSSLFMVDGFVTATSVQFLKFNTNMVPMQCKITVSMNAMYIGFAKQETFLTKNLEDAAAAQRIADAEDAAAKLELATALTQTLDKFKVAFSTRVTNNVVTWDNTEASSDLRAPAWLFGVKEANYGVDVNGNGSTSGTNFKKCAFAGFPSVEPVEGGSTNNNAGDPTREGQDKDAILTLYEEGTNPTITYNWTLKIYGPGRGSTATISEATARAARRDKTYLANTTFKLMGLYAASETASSKEEWGSGTSGDGSKKERIRRRSYDSGDLPENTADKSYSTDGASDDDIPDSFKNSYYIVEIEITVSAKASTATESVQSRTTSFVIGGEQQIGEHKFALSWQSNANQTVIIVG
jgi:hypothetical protein